MAGIPEQFPCIQCGLCCRNRALVTQFPLPWDEQRQCCAHLTEAGLCGIYEERPSGCRVSWTMDLNQSVGLTRLQAYNFQVAVCNTLLRNAGQEEEIPFAEEANA